ncbi:protein-ribulosamine 3-kinase, chloroplastic [Achaetomium macrosporum]|uniref:protein-ribulosamine 3-kinase n=1 Tax=Achaetomium macrosporum TaxID=79813 RepID=A0AAN7CA19_9PEZI|nr:protein-ribulosamine 3-kinase, chloroplastic [Achaetomium macrosporum]
MAQATPSEFAGVSTDALQPQSGESASAGKADSKSFKEMYANLGGAFPMHDAVIEALPKGRTFVSVRHYGTSAWTVPGKITARGPGGSDEYYFVKVAAGESGRIMLEGEYESFKMIYQTTPDFIPKPIGSGKYRIKKETYYFYMTEFVDMDVKAAPDPAEFSRRLAIMHKLSKSPTGKFGFHIPTCDGSGDRPHVVDWQDSWAVFYRNLFLGVCRLDLKRNGPWPKYERAIEQVAYKVIPRLLEPLQANGRELKPCLIHGNLYEGNLGISMKTGLTLIFDASSYFAHNEMELGHWKCEFSPVFKSRAYIKHYVRHYRPAEPAEEFEDRIRLYSLKGTINYSAGHPSGRLRKM